MNYNDALTNKRMALIIVIVQLLLLAALLFFPNILVVILATLSFLAAAALWRFGYLLKPIITKQANVIEGFGKYEIPPAQDVIVKKQGNRYFATAYLLINFTASSTEKTAQQIAIMKQSYERSISSLNHICKISNMICPVDLTPYVDRIKEKRSKAESKLSELAGLPLSANQGAEMARLRREIDSCANQLERIQEGERPMRMLNFAMTCATDHSKDNAIAKVKSQANELKTVVASTMDSEVNIIEGDELKKCFEWDYMLPQKNEEDEFLY